MQFRQRNGSQRYELMLHPWSVLVFADDARYEWTHAIPAHKTDAVYGLVFARRRRPSVTLPFGLVRGDRSSAEVSLSC